MVKKYFPGIKKSSIPELFGNLRKKRNEDKKLSQSLSEKVG
jgi:hypothetical protein